MVNTVTAATQMSKERARPYRALCTPGREGRGPSAGLHRGHPHSPHPHGPEVLGLCRWAPSQLAVPLWVSHLTSLSPHFFICKMG